MIIGEAWVKDADGKWPDRPTVVADEWSEADKQKYLDMHFPEKTTKGVGHGSVQKV